MQNRYCVVLISWLLVGCGPCHVPNAAHPVIHQPDPSAPRPIEPAAPVTSAKATVQDRASVIVEAPVIPSVEKTRTLAEIIENDLKDALFGYDRHDLSPEARAVLDQDAAVLKSVLRDFPGLVLMVEGHCDERGSAEYNLALGDLRARAARDFLLQLGVPENHLAVITYGKEHPQCEQQAESCWQKNRRAHICGEIRRYRFFGWSGSTA